MTTAVLAILLVAVAIVMTAARLVTLKRRKATTQRDDEYDFSGAPYWAGVLDRKLNRILAWLGGISKQVGLEAEADYRRDRKIMATQAEMVEKIRGIKDFSASTNMALREVLKLLREGQSDPAKNAEAIALLEEIQADDMAILKENTPIDPSAN